MLSPHQIRQAGARAFRNRQRGLDPRATRPRRVGDVALERFPAIAEHPAPVSAAVRQSSLRQMPPAPSVVEQLCAAAHRILSDGRPHSSQAQAWALQFLEQATPSAERTAFIRAARRRLAAWRSFA